ncbi:penicillin-binding protein 2 [Microbispora cellulosiformans]|uniref:Penicillin-binding protein 2 n=1 Tax=Microbispora cellulosiformans TaxID=2614688 RepID=A0A5J5K6J2_9ACTN|nr:penicillin-binding protein 2 [Microbispora cellulosiformans]
MPGDRASRAESGGSDRGRGGVAGRAHGAGSGGQTPARSRTAAGGDAPSRGTGGARPPAGAASGGGGAARGASSGSSSGGGSSAKGPSAGAGQGRARTGGTPPRTPARTPPGTPPRTAPRTPSRAPGGAAGRTPPRPPRAPGPPPPPRPPAVLRLGNPVRRLRAAMLVMAIVLSLFAGRLVQLQGLDSKVLQAKAVQQRVQPEILPARRGAITDAEGHELAVTVEAREVYVDPKDVDPAKRDLVATTLARELNKPKQDIDAALAKVTQRYIPLARDVEPLRAKRIMGFKLRGVGTKETYRRLYPGKSLAGGLLGFTGVDGRGLEGLESAYNDVLAGRDGKQSIELGANRQRIPMTRSQREAPVPGRDVRLTINRDLQWAAEQTLARRVNDTGARSGSVIVMDVLTGRILAMANAPQADLNDWQSAPAEDRANRAVSEIFEPGSTNKVITAAAAMEAGVVTPDTVFRVPDHIQCADRQLKDAHPHAPESMTFTGVLAESSNVGTIMAAEKISSQRLYDMFRSFGFGASSGSRVPGEQDGLLPRWETWSGSQRCTIAYGQGISVTALQMASVYQTIANGGVRVTPSIVAGTTDAHGAFVPAPAAKGTRVISETTARSIALMLEAAVGHEGTGEEASIEGYRVAGKTGTAMRYDEKCAGYCGYTATFVGFAPADQPRLMALAVIQDPKKDHYGGAVAAPVFKDVMTFALKNRKIPPTGTKAPAMVLRPAG